MKSSKLIYHYTNFEAFTKIVSNNTLRFSNVNHLNDYLENKMIWEEYNKTNGKDTIDYFHKQEELNISYFVLSLSNKRNSSMMYGVYNADICIGFDEEEVIKYVNSIKQVNKGFIIEEKTGLNAKYNGVNYLDKKQLKTKFSNLSNNIAEKFNNLCESSVFLKNKDWSHEDERRILLKYYTRTNIVDDNRNIINISYYVDKTKFYTYFDLPFPRSMIREIIIGPRCHVSKGEMNAFLFGNSFFDVNIYSYFDLEDE